MPGIGNWRTLYALEHLQLKEEGYPVPHTSGGAEKYLPFPDPVQKNKTEQKPAQKTLSDREWKEAYTKLWSVREQGIRPEFPYIEPDDLASILAAAPSPPGLTPVDMARYAEKIRGAWHGRCAGVILGKPFESDLDRRFIRKYLESIDAYPLYDFVAGYSEKLDIRLRSPRSTKGNITCVEDDDDTRYTILALLLTEKAGLSFTKQDVCRNVLQNVPYTELWSAMKQSIYHYINMDEDLPYDEQVDTFATRLNPMREGINGAIRADFWGYIAPADPRAAAALAHREASLNMVKNGLYGAMFVAGCISGALSRNPTVESILACGLSVIPQTSRLAEVIRRVGDWYREDLDWTVTCDRIYAQYGHLPFAGALNNLAIVVLALLHGRLDFTRSITTAVMCGMDTDCNSGTVGSIVGAAGGIERIDTKWTEPFHDQIRTCAAQYTCGSISDLVERTVRVHDRLIIG
jgi:ADP-ribosylglycohydrolase